jgi:hypothetical protein
MFLYFRLVYNVQKSDGDLLVSDIENASGVDCEKTLAKYVLDIFGVKIKRVWNEARTGKVRVFENLKIEQRVQSNATELTFSELCEKFKYVRKDESEIVFNVDNKKLVLNNNRQWKLVVNSGEADLQKFDIDNIYHMSECGVSCVLDLVKVLHVCESGKSNSCTKLVQRAAKICSACNSLQRVAIHRANKRIKMDIEQCSTSSITVLSDSPSVVNLVVDQSTNDNEAQVIQSRPSLNNVQQVDVGLMSDSCSDVDLILGQSTHDSLIAQNTNSSSFDSHEQVDTELVSDSHSSVNISSSTCKSKSKVKNNSNEQDIDALNKLFHNGTEEVRKFIAGQLKACNAIDSRGNRWDQDFMALCLRWYNRCPQAYEDVRCAKYFFMPSPRLLSMYKNSVQQTPGLNNDLLQWMWTSAQAISLPSEGRSGGLVLDECSIQECLTLKFNSNGISATGFVDLGAESSDLDTLSNVKDKELATHVLQIVFLGYSGFRWPIAHYPVVQARSTDMYIQVWQAIDRLEQWDFHVEYVCLDGAIQNRQLVHIHFPQGNQHDANFSVPNQISPTTRRLYFTFDYSHVCKRLRNNVWSSGKNKTRLLTCNGLEIIWDMWEECYRWDCTANKHSLHHKLTTEHIFPTAVEKMRNHLAEDVLNGEMLNLMKVYQKSLGGSGARLDGAIRFLEQTSKLIAIFRNPRPICELDDNRLDQLRDVHRWFKSWESECRGKQSSLMSGETREDLDSLITSFICLTEDRVKKSGWGIVPSRFNSDIVENIFCQQRGIYHGNNTNPTYSDYQYGTNSLILGQTLLSRKRKSNCDLQPTPFTVSLQKTLKSRVSTSQISTQVIPSIMPQVIEEHVAMRSSQCDNESELSMKHYKLHSCLQSDCTAEETAVALALAGHSFFLTGPSGSGKTTVLKMIINQLGNRKVAVCATTGMAARNLQLPHASTVHRWAGLLDGRHNAHELVRRLSDEDSSRDVLIRVQSAEVLLIDEISMLSARVFELLNVVCCTARKSTMPFGGLQLICCGDFRQLPPVPNEYYHDDGKYAFESSLWATAMSHVVHLPTVRRHSSELAFCIDRMLCDELDDSQLAFLKSLQRPLSARNSTHLYATNIEVDSHNTKEAFDMEGKQWLFKAVDTGSRADLQKCPLQPQLVIKVGAPVMLVVSLSEILVNGMRGRVKEITENGITVDLDNFHGTYTLSRYIFRQYSPISKQVVASREQFPVRLTFAMTVYKCQGQTLDNVVVHCDRMLRPGEFAVAIGRARSHTGVQVVNFQRSCCVAAPASVREFYKKPCSSIKDEDICDNLSCCRVKEINFILPSVTGETEVKSKEGDTDDEHDEDDGWEESEDMVKMSLDIGNDIRQSLLAELPTTTPAQRSKISKLESLTEESVGSFVSQCQFKLQEAGEFEDSGSGTAKCKKSIVSWYSEVSTMQSTMWWRRVVRALFGSQQPSDEEYHIAWQLFNKIRAHVISTRATQVLENSNSSDSTTAHVQVPPESAASLAQCRYIGGYCIAKHLYKQRVRLSAAASLDSFRLSEQNVKLLSALIISDKDVHSSSEYTETLHEIDRRQNNHRSLVYINDATFQYFQMLANALFALERSNKICTLGPNYYAEVMGQLKTNAELYATWEQLFSSEAETVASTVQHQLACHALHETVMHTYICAMMRQKRNQFLRERNVKKKSALRSGLKQQRDVTTSNELIETRSAVLNGIATEADHLCLQLNIIKRPEVIAQSFTKAHLQCTLKRYDISFRSQATKQQLVDMLVANVSALTLDRYQSGVIASTTATDSTAANCVNLGSMSMAVAVYNSMEVENVAASCYVGESDKCVLCNESSGDEWIACDECHKWHHRLCVGITDNIWELLAATDCEWICYPCNVATKKTIRADQ